MIDKYAVLSMDMEDWYHLDYYRKCATDRSVSMMDGVRNYVDLLDAHNMKTTFFVLSELIEQHKNTIMYIADHGHEIACHGKTHIRPMQLSVSDFEEEIKSAKASLEDVIGREVIGYRAPCYSIDNQRYEIVRNAGFKYSSSRMDIPGHPLYGDLDLTGYNQPFPGVYEKDGFYEFTLSTTKFLGRNIAVSGGGWIRLFPWRPLMKPLIMGYLDSAQLYTLYIHPFETSRVKMPKVKDASFINEIRAKRGLGKVESRVEQLLCMLEDRGFKAETFGDLAKILDK